LKKTYCKSMLLTCKWCSFNANCSPSVSSLCLRPIRIDWPTTRVWSQWHDRDPGSEGHVQLHDLRKWLGLLFPSGHLVQGTFYPLDSTTSIQFNLFYCQPNERVQHSNKQRHVPFSCKQWNNREAQNGLWSRWGGPLVYHTIQKIIFGILIAIYKELRRSRPPNSAILATDINLKQNHRIKLNHNLLTLYHL